MPVEEHPVFDTPPRDTVIWRYMDFSKFVSMLSTSSLYFPRADRLGDPFEGSVPAANPPPLPPDILKDAGMHEALETISRFRRQIRERIGVSCWHMNAHESAAMWRLYLQSGDGIAIKTTVGRLVDAMSGWNRTVYVGTIRYLDYSREMMPIDNVFWPLTHKRLSFAHEQELRAITFNSGLFDPETGPLSHGLSVPVPIPLLVESVHVSPAAETWIVDLVSTTARRFGTSFDVRQSSLIDEPLF